MRKYTTNIKRMQALGAAALAAGILGAGALTTMPRAKADNVQARVVRAQESGYCVISAREIARDAEDESRPMVGPTQEEPEPEAEFVMIERDLRVDVPLIRGCVPVPNAVSEAQEAPKAYTEAELEIFACAIYQEAGGDKCSDLCRMYVGDVMLNRVDDPRFPNTLYEVLTQKHQYGLFWKTGIIWPGRASDPNEAAAVERAYDTARALLEGEHSELYGAGYIYQDTKPRGKDVIYLDGEYFGR